MNKKEKIIQAFNHVPLMTRDQLVQMFFRDNTDPVRLCARYMRELAAEKKVILEKRYRPFIAFSTSKKVRRFTGKIWHHVGVVDCILKLKPKSFLWEPDLGEATPDALFLMESRFLNEVKQTYYFLEYQSPQSHWSLSEMQKKISRYEKAYRRNKWAQYCNKPPILWIVTNKPYKVESDKVKIIQKPV